MAEVVELGRVGTPAAAMVGPDGPASPDRFAMHLDRPLSRVLRLLEASEHTMVAHRLAAYQGTRSEGGGSTGSRKSGGGRRSRGRRAPIAGLSPGSMSGS